MTWVKRKIDEHQCPKPLWKGHESVGDIWQCDSCKRLWEIIKIDFEDRPCGNISIRWDLYEPLDVPKVTQDDAARGNTRWQIGR